MIEIHLQPSTELSENKYLDPIFLPDDIIGVIFSFLDARNACSCMLVDKNWYKIGNVISEPWKYTLLNDVQFRHESNRIQEEIKITDMKWRTALIHERSKILNNFFNYFEDKIPGSSLDTQSTIGQPHVIRLKKSASKIKNLFIEIEQDSAWIKLVLAAPVGSVTWLCIKSWDPEIPSQIMESIFIVVAECFASILTSTPTNIINELDSKKIWAMGVVFSGVLISVGVAYIGADLLRLPINLYKYYRNREYSSYSLQRLCKYTRLAITQKTSQYIDNGFKSFAVKSSCNIL